MRESDKFRSLFKLIIREKRKPSNMKLTKLISKSRSKYDRGRRSTSLSHLSSRLKTRIRLHYFKFAHIHKPASFFRSKCFTGHAHFFPNIIIERNDRSEE